jgi:hypothetical protein
MFSGSKRERGPPFRYSIPASDIGARLPGRLPAVAQSRDPVRSSRVAQRWTRATRVPDRRAWRMHEPLHGGRNHVIQAMAFQKLAVAESEIRLTLPKDGPDRLING